MPLDTVGQATSEGLPQFRPDMMESCGPGTDTMRPAATDSNRQSALVGSTLMSFGAAKLPGRRKWRATAAAKAPTPTCTTTRSGPSSFLLSSSSSISHSIVE